MTDKPKKRNRTKITEKQAKALALIKEGKTPRSAMLEAGYSAATASHPSDNLLRTNGAQSIIEQYKAEYIKVGITPSYLAQKTKEWLEATKPIGAKILVAKDGSVIDADSQGAIEVPDYQTQIKAAEFAREDLGLKKKDTIAGEMKDGDKSVRFIITRGEE